MTRITPPANILRSTIRSLPSWSSRLWTVDIADSASSDILVMVNVVVVVVVVRGMVVVMLQSVDKTPHGNVYPGCEIPSHALNIKFKSSHCLAVIKKGGEPYLCLTEISRIFNTSVTFVS